MASYVWFLPPWNSCSRNWMSQPSILKQDAFGIVSYSISKTAASVQNPFPVSMLTTPWQNGLLPRSPFWISILLRGCLKKPDNTPSSKERHLASAVGGGVQEECGIPQAVTLASHAPCLGLFRQPLRSWMFLHNVVAVFLAKTCIKCRK